MRNPDPCAVVSTLPKLPPVEIKRATTIPNGSACDCPYCGGCIEGLTELDWGHEVTCRECGKLILVKHESET